MTEKLPTYLRHAIFESIYVCTVSATVSEWLFKRNTIHFYWTLYSLLCYTGYSFYTLAYITRVFSIFSNATQRYTLHIYIFWNALIIFLNFDDFDALNIEITSFCPFIIRTCVDCIYEKNSSNYSCNQYPSMDLCNFNFYVFRSKFFGSTGTDSNIQQRKNKNRNKYDNTFV